VEPLQDKDVVNQLQQKVTVKPVLVAKSLIQKQL